MFETLTRTDTTWLSRFVACIAQRDVICVTLFLKKRAIQYDRHGHNAVSVMQRPVGDICAPNTIHVSLLIDTSKFTIHFMTSKYQHEYQCDRAVGVAVAGKI